MSSYIGFEIEQKDIICPLSKKIFKNPVTVTDGFIYEKNMITEWFLSNDTSPMTKEKTENIMIKNNMILNKVNNFLEKHPEQIINQYEYTITSFDQLKTIKPFDFSRVSPNCVLDIFKFLTISDVDDIFSNIDDIEKILRSHNKIIHYICKYSKSDIVTHTLNYYCEHNFDITHSNMSGCKPIHFICENGNKDNIKQIIDIYLSKNFDIECNASDEWIPINLICEHSDSETIKYIIDVYKEKKLYFNRCSENKWTPIHFICRNPKSSDEIIKYIIDTYIENNISLECETSEKLTPLHLICKYASREVFNYIVMKNVIMTNNTINGNDIIFQMRGNKKLKLK
jgi:hypothetical protein